MLKATRFGVGSTPKDANGGDSMPEAASSLATVLKRAGRPPEAPHGVVVS